MCAVSDKETGPLFACSAGVHAALRDEQWAVQAASAAAHPLMLIQGNNDPNPAPIKEALAGHPLSGKHQVSWLPDVAHGFCATRGDRKVEMQHMPTDAAVGLIAHSRRIR